MESKPLFDLQHRLCYFEAISRLRHWTEVLYTGGLSNSGHARAKQAIDTLLLLMETRTITLEKQ